MNLRCHIFFIVISFLLSVGAGATTAVDDVQVNYLTSFHNSGPAGWSDAGNPYTPPLYNTDRELLIGLSSYPDMVWGLTPAPGHYIRITEEEGVRSVTTGLVRNPVTGDLYAVSNRGSITRLTEDASRLETIFPEGNGVVRYVMSIPVFDNTGRLYFSEIDRASGVSRIMRLNIDETLSEIFRFESGPQNQPGRAGSFIVSEGFIYGVIGYERGVPFVNALSDAGDFPVGALYQLNPDSGAADKDFEILHEFTLQEGEIPTLPRVGGIEVLTVYLTEHEGYLYGSTSAGTCFTRSIDFEGEASASGRNAICGGEYSLYSYGRPSRLLLDTPFPHYDGPNPYGSLYRIRKDGSDFTLLHTFSGEDGSQPRGPLVIADGYLYGTTMGGGAHSSELRFNASRVGAAYPVEARNLSSDGTIYRIDLSEINIENNVALNSGFEHVHSFKAGPDSDVDGKVPTGLMLASNGRLYGTTLYGGRAYTNASSEDYQSDNKGTVFEVDLRGDIPGGSVTISAVPASIQGGESAEITWSSSEASECISAGGDGTEWVQDAEISSQGSIVVTPESGVYFFTINCLDDIKGGRVGHTVTLYVDTEARIRSSEVLEYGNGSGSLSPFILVLLSLLVLSGGRRP